MKHISGKKQFPSLSVLLLAALLALTNGVAADAQKQPTEKQAAERAATTEKGSTNRVASSRFRRESEPNDVIARIREEGLNHSQVMQTLSYLSDVIGPRLTGSPSLKRANEWTRDTMACWGLTNAHLEAWGPFGRGWSLKRFSAQIIEPQAIPLAGFPKAWTPGLDRPIVADVVYLDAKNEADLEKHKGKLTGAIVLTSPLRQIKARFEPLASRMAETNLLRLANAGANRAGAGRSPRGATDTAEGTPTSGRGRFGTNLDPRGVTDSTLSEGAPFATNAARAEFASGRRGAIGQTNLF